MTHEITGQHRGSQRIGAGSFSGPGFVNEASRALPGVTTDVRKGAVFGSGASSRLAIDTAVPKASQRGRLSGDGVLRHTTGGAEGAVSGGTPQEPHAGGRGGEVPPPGKPPTGGRPERFDGGQDPDDSGSIGEHGERKEVTEIAKSGEEVTTESLRPQLADALSARPFRGGYHLRTKVDGSDVQVHTYDFPNNRSYKQQPASATAQERIDAGIEEGWGAITVRVTEPSVPSKHWSWSVREEEDSTKLAGYEYHFVKPSELNTQRNASELATIFGIQDLSVLRGLSGGSPEQLKKATGNDVDLDKPVIIAKTITGIGNRSTWDLELIGARTKENAHHHDRLRAIFEGLRSGIGATGEERLERSAIEKRQIIAALEGDSTKKQEILRKVKVTALEGLNDVLSIVGQHGTMIYDGEPGRYISQDLREGKISGHDIPSRIFQTDVAAYPGQVDNFSFKLMETPIGALPVPEETILPGSLTTILVGADLVNNGHVEGHVTRAYTTYRLRSGVDPAIAGISPDYNLYRTPSTSQQIVRVVSFPVGQYQWLPVVQQAQAEVLSQQANKRFKLL